MSAIDFIKQKLEQGTFSDMDFESIKPLLYHLPILPLKLLAPTKIIRSSTNEDEKFHESISRLTYPPKEFARTDRASLQGKPMFYACVFVHHKMQEDAIPPRVISAFETTDLFKQYVEEGKVCTTQSLWTNSRPLQLLTFPSLYEWNRPCEEITELREFWVLHKKEFCKYYSEEQISLAEYMGKLMATENYSCLYDITARVTQYLLYDSYWGNSIDGIAYPSTKGDGMGFNICLKPEVVDTTIHFQAATVAMIIKKKGKQFQIFQIADSVQLGENILKWTPTKLTIEMLVEEYGKEVLDNPRIIEWVDGY